MEPDAANRPRTLGSPGYEAWYVIVQDPVAMRGVWLRYTTLRPSAGSSASAGSALWAMSFDRADPSLNTATKLSLPLSEATFARSGPRIGASVLEADGCRGSIDSEAGSARWDLSWRTTAAPFAYLDPRFQILSTVSNIAARPQLSISGEVVVGGRTLRFDAAPGSQQHTWGVSHALLQNWACAGGLGEDGTGWVAGATVRVRSRLGRAIGGTSMGVRLAGRDLSFNSPLAVMRNPGRISPECWDARVRSHGLTAEVRVVPRREDLIGVTYTDPDGGRRICYHTEVADLEMTLLERGAPVARVTREGACAFEYQSDSPLPGLAPRL